MRGGITVEVARLIQMGTSDRDYLFKKHEAAEDLAAFSLVFAVSPLPTSPAGGG